MELPFSAPCERNKTVILSKLKHYFSDVNQVLEVGSGTAQHAIYFARNLPHLNWYTADLQENHEGINARIQQAGCNNVYPPIALNLSRTWELPAPLSNDGVDAIFTSNTLHIVSESLVENFFNGVGKHLKTNGILCIYGPFNYAGEYTSASNAEFDVWLKDRDMNSGIRDIDYIKTLAKQVNLAFIVDDEMPANNRLLVLRKLGANQ